MQALKSNVMNLALNLKGRSRSVARVTLYNIKYVIMKAIIRYCYLSPKVSWGIGDEMQHIKNGNTALKNGNSAGQKMTL